MPFILLCLCAVLLSVSSHAASIVSTSSAATPDKSPTIFFPSAEILTDLAAADIDQAISRSDVFAPYIPSISPIPLRGYWFRFPVKHTPTDTLWLDLNTLSTGNLPKHIRVFSVNHADASSFTELNPTAEGLYRLPDFSEGSPYIYLYTYGIPGPSFAPSVRTADTLSQFDMDAKLYLTLMFCAVTAFIFIYGVVERRKWRIFAALYAVFASTGVMFGTSPIPAESPFSAAAITLPINLSALFTSPGIFAVCVALFLFPHLGRMLTMSKSGPQHTDILLTLAAYPALLCLLPLLPHSGSMYPLLTLWPFCFIFSIPAALSALTVRRPAAISFLIAALIPLAGTLGFTASEFSTALLQTEQTSNLTRTLLKFSPHFAILAQLVFLLLIPSPRVVRASDNAATVNPPADPRLAAHDCLNRLQRELESIPTASVTPDLAAWTKHALVDLSTIRSRMLSGVTDFNPDTLPNAGDDEQSDVDSRNEKTPSGVFGLHRIIRAAHNSLIGAAEDKGISLSWYMAPQLPQRCEGDYSTLEKLLSLLLNAAVQSTEHGYVRLCARRLPESNDPGHILITVTDTGAQNAPGRNPDIAAEAWRLAAYLDGAFSFISEPTGTTVSVAVRFKPVRAESAEITESTDLTKSPNPTSETLLPHQTLNGAPRIIIAGSSFGPRQMWAYYLDDLPYEVREARTATEAAAMYAHIPGALIILDGSLGKSDIIEAIARIRTLEQEHGYPLTSVILIADNDEQSSQMMLAGCTHTLIKPVSGRLLRHQILTIAPLRSKIRHQNSHTVINAVKDDSEWSLRTGFYTPTPIHTASGIQSSPPQPSSQPSTSAAEVVKTAPDPISPHQHHPQIEIKPQLTPAADTVTAFTPTTTPSDTEKGPQPIPTPSNKKTKIQSFTPNIYADISADQAPVNAAAQTLRPNIRHISTVGDPTPINHAALQKMTAERAAKRAHIEITDGRRTPQRPSVSSVPPPSTTTAAPNPSLSDHNSSLPRRASSPAANNLPGMYPEKQPRSSMYFTPKTKRGFFDCIFGGKAKKSDMKIDDFILNDAPQSDWVGEPTPIVKTKNKPVDTLSQRTLSAASDLATETLTTESCPTENFSAESYSSTPVKFLSSQSTADTVSVYPDTDTSQPLLFIDMNPLKKTESSSGIPPLPVTEPLVLQNSNSHVTDHANNLSAVQENIQDAQPEKNPGV